MIKLLLPAALGALALALASPAAAEEVHVISNLSSEVGAVSTAAMDARIEAAANGPEARGHRVNRAVFFYVTFPHDAQEYVAVGGYSIVLFMAVSQDDGELPLRRAVLRVDGKETPLLRVFAFGRDTADGSAARRVFGRSRMFTYYLVPTAALIADRQLICDFAAGESGFVVDRSADMTPAYLTPQVAAAAAQATPSLDALRAFLTREYPGTSLDIIQRDVP